MQYTLAVLLLFASIVPANAMTMLNFSLEVVNPKEGYIARFYPFEDMDREQCMSRLNDIILKAPSKAFCVGRVVKREFS